MPDLKKYDLVIASTPARLIADTNEAISVGYVPRGGAINVDGTWFQSIYLRPKTKKPKK